MAEGEAVAVGMLAMLMFRQEVMYMGQHTAVHLRWLDVSTTEDSARHTVI